MSGGTSSNSFSFSFPEVSQSTVGASTTTSPFGAPSTAASFGAPSSTSHIGARTTNGDPATTSIFDSPDTSFPFGHPDIAPAATCPFGSPANTSFDPPTTTSPFIAPSNTSFFGPPSTTSSFGPPETRSSFVAPTNTFFFGSPPTTSLFGPRATTSSFVTPTDTSFAQPVTTFPSSIGSFNFYNPPPRTTTFPFGKLFSPFIQVPQHTLTFTDDEPLPSLPSPTPLQPNSSPSTTATITTHPEYPAVLASSSISAFTVLVHVRAPPAPASTRDRTPIDLVAVLDVSGSMSGHKLALVKRAVAFIIQILGPNDRLSVVSFADNSNRVLPLTCMTDTGRLRASTAVNALYDMGGTNIKAGLDMGVSVLDQRRHRNPVAGIILLSDGQDTTGYCNYGNHGSKDYSYLVPDNTTIPIHTFGFGGDHDPIAMHTIADATSGTFSFIDVEGDIQDAFAMCIGGLLSVAALKFELMVSAAIRIHIASVSSGSYSSNVLGHGLAAVIEFGDLYADEEKDILVHLTVPEAGGSLEMQLITVRASYKEPLSQQVVYVDGEAASIRRPDVLLPEDEVVSLRVDRQRNRLLVGESIKDAQERAERQDFGGAKEVLTSRRAALLASASAQAGDGLCGWLDAELTEIQKRMADARVYDQSGRAYALAGSGAHLQQRSAAGATFNRAMAFGASTGYGSAGPARSPFGESGASFFGGGVPQCSSMFGCSNIGYQIDAMLKMVAKSRSFAGQDPSDMTMNED